MRLHQQSSDCLAAPPQARGSGKSLLLDQCVEAFQDELDSLEKPKFRIVRLNGILVPGSHVNLVVQEILQQLSTSAYHDIKRDEVTDQRFETQENEEGHVRPTKKTKAMSDSAKELFRLRQTSFTNHVQLLNEILQFASVDDIPILFILDELDSFVGMGGSDFIGGAMRMKSAEASVKDRQLLLYHLLDRVATGNSFLSLVGVTCNHGTMSLLEKRIKSRTEGTKFVHFGPCQSMEELLALIVDKLKIHTTEQSSLHLYTRISEILSPPATEGSDPAHQRVYESFRRSQRLGFDVRWCCRVLYMALSAYRHDCIRRQGVPETSFPRPLFASHYVWDALVAMGGAVMPGGQSHLLVTTADALPDRRMQALRDLSGPQVALILSAWRILRRDNKKEIDTASLTMERILNEYKSYRGSANNYSTPILWKGFYSLMEIGLIRPALDHSGRAPLQYEHDDASYSEMAPAVLAGLPLHLNVDIQKEFTVAMQKNLLNCSTALREWGNKIRH